MSNHKRMSHKTFKLLVLRVQEAVPCKRAYALWLVAKHKPTYCSSRNGCTVCRVMWSLNRRY